MGSGANTFVRGAQAVTADITLTGVIAGTGASFLGTTCNGLWLA